MCGLAGMAFADPRRVGDPELARRMRATLVHRGPDDGGDYAGPGIVLGSQRLAILDLSPRGHMPMVSPDGRYVIAYNGEVYNFRELRELAATGGEPLRSGTDTEVILRLFAREGAAMLDRLNGMFAIAVWDTVERRLFLGRDRLGVKPLYLAQCPDGLVFASEQKSLFAAGIPADRDPEAWEELLTFRFVAGERTIFSHVRRLLPGEYLWYSKGSTEVRRWWDPAEKIRNRRGEMHDDPVRIFGDIFESSVRYRQIADVPVGVLLSGGLDSGSVALSLAAHAPGTTSSFTMRFEDPRFDEGFLARSVAEQGMLDHHEITLGPDHLPGLLADAAWFNDEPLAHASDVHVLAIARFAKPLVTVLLSGEGADEFLGGYVRYQPLAYPGALRAGHAVPGLLRVAGSVWPRMRKLSRFMELGGPEVMMLFNAAEVLPTDLGDIGFRARGVYPYRQQSLAEAAGLFPGDLVRQAMYSDQRTFLSSLLDRNDRMTMGASIECRVPFLDFRLAEFLGGLPTSRVWHRRNRKDLLVRSAGRRLPAEVVRGRKWGFGVPWARYLREIPAFTDMLRSAGSHPLFDELPVDRRKVGLLVADFLAGSPSRESLVRQIFMLIVWHEHFLKKLGNPVSEGMTVSQARVLR
jgi:asparagine synthase (glutamine-hydrolysing)